MEIRAPKIITEASPMSLMIFVSAFKDSWPSNKERTIKIPVKKTKVQFAGQLNDEERGRLKTDEAALLKQLANREWKRAKFYEDNKQFGSAKFHYAKILRQFPGTPIANEAQQQYAELEGQPDSPPVLLAKVVDWFPENA